MHLGIEMIMYDIQASQGGGYADIHLFGQTWRIAVR